MKVIEKKSTVEASGVVTTAKFGIKEAGVGHIFHILRNQLYSDAATAVIREYSTNAADAHIEAGIPERPIEVTLPSRFNLQFKVRDYGKSLSPEEIVDIFAFYGESTKRNTNNQTGMLGIGSKSGFAYGDNFVINSYIGGTCTTYNAYIDDSQVGCISKLGETSTELENGLEIVIPVRNDDVEEFISKAKSALENFKVAPLVNGKPLAKAEVNPILEGDDWLWDGNGDEYGCTTAIMGNIGYPIDRSLLKGLNDEDEHSYSNFACGNLKLEFAIGDLEIAASREGLQYSDYTIKSINTKIKKAANEMSAKLEAKFSACHSLYAAKVLANEVFDMHGKLRRAREILRKKISYKGKDIDTQVKLHDIEVGNLGKVDNLEGYVEVHRYVKSYRGHQKVRPEKVDRFDTKDTVVLIENTESHRRGVLKRIVPLVEDDNKKPVMFTWKANTSPKMKEYIVEHLGMVQDDFVQLTDIPEVDIVANYGLAYGSRSSSKGSRGGNSTKNKESVFVFNEGSSYSPQSENWDATYVDLDNDKVVYVEIDRYQFIDDRGIFCPSRSLNPILQHLNNINKNAPKVIGVKVRQISKFKESKNATLLWDYLKAEVNRKLKGEAGQWIANECVINEIETDYREFFKNIGDSDLGEGTLSNVRDALSKHKDVTKVDGVNSVRECMNRFGSVKFKLPKPTISKDLFVGLEKLYPILPMLVGTMTGYWEWNRKNALDRKKVKANVLHYVNLVNSSVV